MLSLFERKAPSPSISEIEVSHGGEVYRVALKRMATSRRYTLRVRAASRDVLLTMPARGTLKAAREFAERHAAWIGVLKHHFPGYWMYLVVPVCLGLASALCLVVERPSIYLSRRAGRLVDRVIAGLGRPAQTAPA